MHFFVDNLLVKLYPNFSVVIIGSDFSYLYV